VIVTVTHLGTGRTATGTPIQVHRAMQRWYTPGTVADLLTTDALIHAVERGDRLQHDLAAVLGVAVDVHPRSNGAIP
jgi:hypothetical protein